MAKMKNIDGLKDIKGYSIGHNQGVNTSFFLKTLSNLNDFIQRVEKSTDDMERKKI